MDVSSCMQLGVHTVTQSSPSPTISGIYNIPSFGEVSRISSADSGNGGSSYSSEGSGSNKVLKDVHISAQLLEDFLALAKENTDKDMETCGVLGAFLIMVPEAVAIVMAPTDNSRNYGIYRLSEPDGVTILKECQEKGFHIHREPSDGRPIYEHCSNVYVNPTLRFEIFDLR